MEKDLTPREACLKETCRELYKLITNNAMLMGDKFSSECPLMFSPRLKQRYEKFLEILIAMTGCSMDEAIKTTRTVTIEERARFWEKEGLELLLKGVENDK